MGSVPAIDHPMRTYRTHEAKAEETFSTKVTHKQTSQTKRYATQN